MSLKKFFVTIVLVISIAFPNFVFAQNSTTLLQDKIEHGTANFSQITYTEIQESDYTSVSDEIIRLSDNKNNIYQIVELLDELESFIDTVKKNMALTEIYTNQDYTNKGYSDMYIQSRNTYIDVYDTYVLTFKALINSECADFITRGMSKDTIDFISNYEKTDEETNTAIQKQNELVMEYNSIASQDFTVNYKSQYYDQSGLNNLYIDGELKYYEYVKLTQTLQKDKNAKLAPIYLELVKLRNEMASSEGYENYYDYAYKNVYSRDYTHGDLKAFQASVKKNIVPLYKKISSSVYEYDYSELKNMKFDENKVMNDVKKHLPEISDELLTAFNYMQQYNLYDLKDSNLKSDVGFTLKIPVINQPFMFNKPYNSFLDYFTVVHEYGHYNAMYFSSDEEWAFDPGKVDLSEIHSQALELLFLDYTDEIFGEDSAAVDYYIFANIITTIMQACITDEFEVYAYDHPEATVKELNKAYYNIIKDYGIETFDGSEAYDWVGISHIYSSPLYTISYSISASSALDIWKMSLTDRNAAVEAYLKLVNKGQMNNYQETIESVGLNNPIKTPNFDGLFTGIENYIEGKNSIETETDTDVTAFVNLNDISNYPFIMSSDGRFNLALY